MDDEACCGTGVLRTALEKTFEEAPIGMAIVAPDGRFLHANVSFAELVGYTPTELTNLTFQAITHPEDVAVDVGLLRQLAAGEIQRYRLEKRYRRKNGTFVEAYLSVSVVREDDGSPRFYLSQIIDTSDIKRAERQERFLADAAATFNSTLDFEKALRLVAQLAVRDVADCCFIDIEDGVEFHRLEVAGRDPEHASSWDVLCRVDPAWRSLTRDTLESGRTVLLESVSDEVIRRAARDEDHLRALRALQVTSFLSVPLFGGGGTILGAIAFLTSRGSRSYTPADARFAERLAHLASLAIENARLYTIATHATKVRDEALAMVAHDLRSPLNRILLHAQKLQRDPGRSEQSERSASIVERAVTQMSSLLRDLLDAARLDEHALPVDKKPIPAEDVIAEAAESQRAAAQSASVDLAVEVAAPAGEVNADRGRLLQVLDNLVGNAIKFTPSGGQVRLGASQEGTEVVFQVRDTGRGIPADEVPHLFDRFWQADEKRHQGTGLGLAIAKGIVEAHGGRIWVDSVPGRGSAFYFTIPRAP